MQVPVASKNPSGSCGICKACWAIPFKMIQNASSHSPGPSMYILMIHEFRTSNVCNISRINMLLVLSQSKILARSFGLILFPHRSYYVCGLKMSKHVETYTSFPVPPWCVRGHLTGNPAWTPVVFAIYLYHEFASKKMFHSLFMTSK